MKKNKTLRLASGLLVAVLLTTCTIAGTFAKYVTEDSAQDNARVAKWGVAVEATGQNAETDAFGAKYNDAMDANGTKVVSNVSGEDVLAPGTNGDLASITIGGTPEVMVDIAVTADLVLTGWVIEGVEYCPIVFTVGDKTFKINGSTITTVAELEAAVEEQFTSLSATNVAANTPLTRSVAVSWAWDFDDNGRGTNDAKDTALGNLTGNAVPIISFTCAASVTQVD